MTFGKLRNGFKILCILQLGITKAILLPKYSPFPDTFILAPSNREYPMGIIYWKFMLD